MILPNYTSFRGFFAISGADLGPDGFEEWPLAKLRASSFDDLNVPTSTEDFSDTYTFTVNAIAPDAVPGVDEYDWYLSQRTDDLDSQYVLISAYTPGHSGTVTVDLNPLTIANLLPFADPSEFSDPDNLALILRDCAIYCHRRSDDAYQWCALLQST